MPRLRPVGLRSLPPVLYAWHLLWNPADDTAAGDLQMALTWATEATLAGGANWCVDLEETYTLQMRERRGQQVQPLYSHKYALT